jgi:hypothetical protein
LLKTHHEAGVDLGELDLLGLLKLVVVHERRKTRRHVGLGRLGLLHLARAGAGVAFSVGVGGASSACERGGEGAKQRARRICPRKNA